MGPSSAPGRSDLAVAAVFVVLALVELVVTPTPGAFVRLAAMGALVCRRRFPVPVLAVVVVSVLATDADGQTVGILALALATFTVGNELPRAQRSPRRRPWPWQRGCSPGF